MKGLIGNCKDGELRIYTINSGCVPSAAVVVPGGGCLPRVSAQGVSAKEGVCLEGVCPDTPL